MQGAEGAAHPPPCMDGQYIQLDSDSCLNGPHPPGALAIPAAPPSTSLASLPSGLAASGPPPPQGTTAHPLPSTSDSVPASPSGTSGEQQAHVHSVLDFTPLLFQQQGFCPAPESPPSAGVRVAPWVLSPLAVTPHCSPAPGGTSRPLLSREVSSRCRVHPTPAGSPPAAARRSLPLQPPLLRIL